MMCGDVHSKFKDYKQAIESYSIAIQSTNMSFDQNIKHKILGHLHNKRALSNLKLEHYKEAMTDGMQMVRICPKNIMGKLIIAVCSMRLRDIAFATACLADAKAFTAELFEVVNDMRGIIAKGRIAEVCPTTNIIFSGIINQL